MSADADPQSEIHHASAAIEEASRKQFDQLAPNNFTRAVNFRNSAKEKLSRGASRSEVWNDASAALKAIQNVQNIGEANESQFRGVLAARLYAVNAQAPQFQEKQFRSADNSLRSIGERLEVGSYKIVQSDLMEIEKKYSLAEIAARKRVELGSVQIQIDKAKNSGAKSKTPAALEDSLAKLATAEQAIEMSPHNPEGYTAAIAEAKRSAQKLTEVLEIARSKGASEDVALLIWNQNRVLTTSSDALRASGAALTQANAESAKVMNRQSASIAALKSANREYANEEELKQKIAELQNTFSSDEAEIVKDGKKLVVRLKQMQFASSRSELNPNSFATLRKVETLIAAVPVTQITVEGHTDSIGSEEMNKTLSEQRAEAVKKYLQSQGQTASLPLAAAGYGAERPLTTNKTKLGRATNRRVDIVIETPATL